MNKPKKIKFRNLGEDEMLIGGYIEPRMFGRDVSEDNVHDVTKDEAFDDLRASGINTLISTHYCLNDFSDDDPMYIIKEIDKRGMNMLIRDDDNTRDRTDEEAQKHFKDNYAKLEKYKAFAGLHVIDEPGYKDWEKFGRLRKSFKKVYPDKMYFINLLQTYAPHWAISNGALYDYHKGGGLPDDGDIEKYYKSFVEEVEPDVFSYDFYPIVGEFPSLLNDYFLQLHLAHKYATMANVPNLCFIQSAVWGGGTRPCTLGELMWQVNMALAYDTQGFTYYTYWTNRYDKYNKQCFIDWRGNKTKTYYNGKKVNEFVHYIDEFVVNSVFKGYQYIGVTPNGEIPVSEDRIEKFGNLKSFNGGNLFVGCYEYIKNDIIYNMYYVVNNDIVKSAYATVEFDKKMELTVVGDHFTRTVDDDKVSFNLDPGCAEIIIEEL